MNELESRLQAYLDDELDAVGVAHVEAELARSPAAARTLAVLSAAREAVRTHAPYHRAPPDIETRLRLALGAVQAPRAAAPRLRALHRTALPIAAAIAGLAIGLLLGPRFAGRASLPLEEQVAMAAHVRALVAGHAVDVVSADTHTVKPWYSSRLDYSPPVPELKEQGFPLLGGRLEVLDQRTVACLVYGHGKHVISLFVLPATTAGGNPRGVRDLVERSRQGLNVVSWDQGGFRYVSVSDLNAEELDRFVQAFAATE